MPIAPIECYIMQGEIPLPEIVVQRFAKTGGELCRGLFLLSKYLYTQLRNGSSCRFKPSQV